MYRIVFKFHKEDYGGYGKFVDRELLVLEMASDQEIKWLDVFISFDGKKLFGLFKAQGMDL